MKNLLITSIASVVLVGFGELQQSTLAPEVKLVTPVTEAAQSEPPQGKAPDISIHDAAREGNIEAVKQHLATGTDVNKRDYGQIPLHWVAYEGHKEIADLLPKQGGNTGEELKLKGNETTSPN